MSGDRRVVVSRGLLRIVQEDKRDAHSGAHQSLYHVEIEGEGILHTYGSLEMALFELEAIGDSSMRDAES